MPTFSPGSRVDDYELLQHVATGAMSEVYEGRHVVSGLRVAVKVLMSELRDQTDLVTRFINEGTTLRHLRHARIVTSFACGSLPDGLPYLVLEWLPMDLRQALSSAGAPLSPRTAQRVAGQLAEALATLHEHGLIHRDLKPANVLLASTEPDLWEVKLGDLGLAKALPSEGTHGVREDSSLSVLPISTGRGMLLGTWEYMPPEQWVEAKSVDPKADVYALGVLLFQMLTGRLPFTADQQKDLMFLHLLVPPPLQQLEHIVPASIRQLIAQMLDKKPAPRPTMRQVQKTLAEPAEP